MPVKQHTAQSLGRYIGQPVRILRFPHKAFLLEGVIRKVRFTYQPRVFISFRGGKNSSVTVDAVQPILKPLPKDLSNFDVRFYFEGHADSLNVDGQLESAMQYAYPNPESPTGYVDLFGYPCVCE